MKKVRLTIAPDLEIEVDDIQYDNLKGQGLLVEENKENKEVKNNGK